MESVSPSRRRWKARATRVWVRKLANMATSCSNRSSLKPARVKNSRYSQASKENCSLNMRIAKYSPRLMYSGTRNRSVSQPARPQWSL